MELTRRDFLKLSGAGAGGALLTTVGSGVAAAQGPKKLRLHKRIGETPSICSYCGVGCGIVMAVQDGKLISLEGDPDHPINEGALCPKANALFQVNTSPQRLTKVLYRAPGATKWEEKTWEWAIAEIAKRIKQTRDKHWIERDGSGNLVNRTETIASVGSVFPNDEEAYAMTKLQRALGLVYIENEARICVSAAVAANTESFGRGPMSNTWIDLGNSDCVMAIGSNVAETFPNGFKWIARAQEKGGQLIHVDPRFTRTSAKADIYAPLRIGTDVAFVNGMIKYVLDDMERNPTNYNLDYVRHYTNASFLVHPDFRFGDGLFSGYDSAKRSYDTSTWQFQKDEQGKIKTDPTLQDPRCVFQLLKEHSSRYDADTVCNITGTPRDVYLRLCATYAATGAKGKAGAIVLSSGACEHTLGTQNVRSYDILQLLLGNMGVAGGGVNGIAGASNGLGCSLQGRLFHWLPGTLAPPLAAQQSLSRYVADGENAAYMTSLLKAWYGDHATAANDYGYSYLGKRGGNYSWPYLFQAIDGGVIKGLICWGMNPAGSGPNSAATREGLRKLEWLVAIDLFETETAAVWKEPGVQSANSKTEVFLLPAASSIEKEGGVTGSARWKQWRYQGPNPPGEAKSDLWIINRLALKLKELYTNEGGPNAGAITNLTWDYGDPPDVSKVARELNGYDLTTGKLMSGPPALKADGTTSCGNWLFCGSYTEAGNLTARRNPVDTSGIGLYPQWAWAWPLNRRIWYNRASVDLNGKPWDAKRPVIGWNAATKTWGGDVADGGWPPIQAAIDAGDTPHYPFIMKLPHERALLFGQGMKEGPLPEHYEPWESPVVRNPMSPVLSSPVLISWEPSEKKGSPDKFPILATTFRLVSHMHTGAITRNLTWLLELDPEMFIEISEELAATRGITNGSRVVVETARGKVEAKAVVTKRLKPLRISGQTVHQIALPWNWGYMGLSKGDSANMLTARVVDPNSFIPAYRAFLCEVRKV